eukprot:Sspe_Gene.57642::Locus_31615_Transcript_1_1_Confidence_1.000_Length_2221::g.57642::m.57642
MLATHTALHFSLLAALASAATFSVHNGYLPELPGDPEPEHITLSEAKQKCLQMGDSCKGFTFSSVSENPEFPVDIFFKSHIEITPNDFWFTYLVEEGPANPPVSPDTPPPPPPSGGGSSACGGGCAFLIIFFVGGFVYFAAGTAFMYIKRDRRGVEAIPHVEFWKDVPFLVRDGGRFLVYKVTGKGSAPHSEIP